MDEESHDSIDMESNDARRNTVVPWRSGKYFIFLLWSRNFFFFSRMFFSNSLRRINNGVNVKKFLNISMIKYNECF